MTPVFPPFWHGCGTTHRSPHAGPKMPGRIPIALRFGIRHCLTHGTMRHMAWEWVAPVAAASGTAIVGGTGIIVTPRVGRRQQTTALAVAQQQADAQVAVAREERQQRRLEAAYLELLKAVTKIHYWAFTVYPLMGPAGRSRGGEFRVADAPAGQDVRGDRFGRQRQRRVLHPRGHGVQRLAQQFMAALYVALRKRTESRWQRSAILATRAAARRAGWARCGRSARTTCGCSCSRSIEAWLHSLYSGPHVLTMVHPRAVAWHLGDLGVAHWIGGSRGCLTCLSRFLL